MKHRLLICYLAFMGLMLLTPLLSGGQLTAPGSVYREDTQYPNFGEKDPMFIFCVNDDGPDARLMATTDLEGTKSWEWEKFNPVTGAFDFYLSENTGSNQSEITGLEDGCYRVRITSGGTTQILRAWVFNNRNNAEAVISESNCTFFTLRASLEEVPLVYYDLSSLAPVVLDKDLRTEWRQGDDILSLLAVRQVYDPPAKDTEYTLMVTDRFGCETSVNVTYHSIVTKASFKADPMSGEAPLKVNFTNNSENGDPGLYEWFIFRDLDEIKKDPSVPVDSILDTAVDVDLTYSFERSGTYMVKLVSKKATGDMVCTDTVYLEDYIMVDTSFVAVPNVFTPNGDGTNDNFVVKFWSMEKVKISVFNRWGRTVHVWESNNVKGFENTWMESVWDGRIGGRYASPGVYFYVVKGTGRDGKKRWKHGDVYLIRDKD